MRRVLVDQARRRHAEKRDGVEVTFATGQHVAGRQDIAIDELDDALERLRGISPELVDIVELKYFGGLTNEEVAEVQKMSASSVKRSWRVARAWLYNELNRTH